MATKLSKALDLMQEGKDFVHQAIVNYNWDFKQEEVPYEKGTSEHYWFGRGVTQALIDRRIIKD